MSIPVEPEAEGSSSVDMGGSHRRPDKRRRSEAPAKETRAVDEGPSQDYINNLPDECLFLIFSLLPAPRDRCRCAAVSRNWFKLQSSMRRSEFRAHALLLPRSRQEISRCIMGRQTNDWTLGAMAIGIDACGVLTDLSVLETLSSPSTPPSQRASNHPHISDVGLSVVTQACNKLKSLRLRNCIRVSNRGIASVAGNCTALTNLELTHATSVTDHGLMLLASRCPNLASLSLAACPSVTDRSLVAFARHSTHVKSFAVANCPLITDFGILSIIVLQTHLQSLRVSLMKLGDSVLQAIASHGREIKRLALDKVWGLSAEGYGCIGEANGLGGVYLDSCMGLTDRCFRRLTSLSFAGLKKVWMKGCNSLTDSSLFVLTRLAVQLESLHLTGFRVFTHRGLVLALRNCSQTLKVLALVDCNFYGHGPLQQEAHGPLALPQECPRMQAIKLEQCSGIGDDFISWIGHSCKNITDVSFVRMDTITDQGIKQLLDELKGDNKIARVDLTGCVRVGNRSVWSITRECRASLKRLVLFGCGRVSDRGAAVITKRCTGLVELDLGGCNISDEAVEKLVEEDPPDLEVLSLAGCTRITDRSLDVFDDYGGLGLNRLNLVGCTGLCRTQVEFLKIYIDEVDY